MSLGPFGWIRELSLGVFRPPPGATSGRVRRSGALGMAFGFVLLGIAVAILVALAGAGVDITTPQRVILLIVFPGLAFMIVGGYRVIAGREPEDASSFRRLALGVAGGVFAMLLVVFAFVLIVLVSELLKR